MRTTSCRCSFFGSILIDEYSEVARHDREQGHKATNEIITPIEYFNKHKIHRQTNASLTETR